MNTSQEFVGFSDRLKISTSDSHVTSMARDKLIPKHHDDDKREPRERFSDLATKIFAVPKSEIDEREKQWRKSKQKPKSLKRS